ncbi:MAG: hypothetical protein NTY11_02880 [Candidatus Parcubacteria bacterium]|nr:hypothetical protein [Candidatus Parcubacteria bacterium]
MLKEYHGDTLYRLEYLSTVLIPILFALIDSNANFLYILKPITGWMFITIGLLLMNDWIDKDRNMSLSHKSLQGLTFMLILLGLCLTIGYNLIFALIFTVLIALYNLKLKNIGLFKNVYLSVICSMIVYWAFAASVNWMSIIVLFIASMCAELVHSIADQDVSYKLLKNKIFYLLTVSFALLFLTSLFSVIIFNNTYQWIIVAAGVIGVFGTIKYRKNLEAWPEIKKIGTEIAKFATIYLFVLLISK